MNEVKQMKKRKRALQKACSLFIMFMLTLTTLKAVGGTIDIHLKDFPNAEKAGVTFTLYKVGSMSDDGKQRCMRNMICTYRIRLKNYKRSQKSLPKRQIRKP